MTAVREDDLATEIASYRPVLYRLALLQLRDKAAAEDATQDALLAAFENQHAFEGRSSVKTWLCSILRFKVIDALRTRKRIGPPVDPSTLAEELDLAAYDGLFDETGCWATPKTAWSDPETHVERVEFFRVLEACLTNLPANTARVFMMREWLELSSKEVCSELGITAGNVRVLLYRARMQLRLCLEDNWDAGR